MYQPNGDKCTDDIVSTSVQNLEAIKWVFKKLNAANYLQGLNLGLDVYQTCRVKKIAAKVALEIVGKTGVISGDTDTKQTFGVIGPDFSEEAKTMSTIFSSVPEPDRLLQISFSATSSFLGDKEVYPSFYRVIQEDSVQMQVIISLMKTIGWNYVAIIHEDDMYGRKGAYELKTLAEGQNICIPEVHALPIGQYGAVSVDLLKQIIMNLTINRRASIGGIIFFGSRKTVNTLLQVVKTLSDSITEVPAFIFSEAVNLHPLDSQTIAVGKGSYTVTPPKYNITDYRYYWVNLLQSRTDLLAESESNPWLLDLHEKVAGCRLTTNSTVCGGLSREQAEKTYTDSVYTPFAMKAAYTMAKVMKVAAELNCVALNTECLSSSLKKSDLLEVIQDIPVDFSVEFGVDTLGSIQSFDERGNVQVAAGFPSYEVYNYQDCGDLFCFKKIGQWQDGALTAETSEIRDYSGGEERTWPSIRKAQCPVSHECPECVYTDLNTAVYFKDGDVIVGALVPVSNKDTNDPVGCSEIRTSLGYEIAESMSFLTKKANERSAMFKDIFPGMTIGLVVINTCNNPLVTQSRLLSLLENGVQMPGGEYVQIRNKLIGFIGEMAATVTTAAQDILRELPLVQVSYASTAPSLSNRNLYPFFMRITPPDNKQTSVMVQLLETLGYNYIQIIYSSGGYGESGRNYIQALAAEHSICVVQVIEIKENIDYNAVVDELRKEPHAKAVITFIRSHVISGLMSSINKYMLEGEFHFIGSEAWDHNSAVLGSNYNLGGTLTLALEMAQNAEYTTHLNELWPGSGNDDPWLEAYIQEKEMCYFPLSFDKTAGRQCSDDDRLGSGPAFYQDMWAPFAMNSLTAFLLGAHQTFTELCGQITFLCDNFIKHPEKLIDNIKKVQLDISLNGQQVILFDENGDGTVGYQIHNIQRDPADNTKLKYVKVGQASDENHFLLYTDKLEYPGGEPIESVCPNEKRCSECFKPQDQTEQTDTSATVTALGVTTGILVVILIILVLVFILMMRRTRQKLQKLTTPDYITPISR
ncbi:hypothetical protein ScPMuIL_012429 [Solemya velum]